MTFNCKLVVWPLPWKAELWLKQQRTIQTISVQIKSTACYHSGLEKIGFAVVSKLYLE